MIYTIGYQNTSMDELKHIMKDKAIDLLVDVRSVPYSRNPMKKDFNKERLIELLGKKYVWMGNICGGREGPVKPACFTALERLFAKNLLLMCMENHPCDCHRFHSIAITLDQNGVEVIHLFDGLEKTTEDLHDLCNDE
jgi:uncharacterized protein (DUF488 family)